MIAAVRREAEDRGRAEGFWPSAKDEAHWRALQAAQRELEAGGWQQRFLDCANYDVLMEGPRFKNWNLTRLNRLREELKTSPPTTSDGGEGRELEAGGWRPIDDAARNSGEEWLLGTTESDFMVVAFWDDTKADFEWQTADGPGYRAGAFTHYMPLPSPPTTSDGGKEKLDWSGIRFRGSCTDV